MEPCVTCKRLENDCICGRKKGYYRCLVCQSDVEEGSAGWHGDWPGHPTCLESLNVAEKGEESFPIARMAKQVQIDLPLSITLAVTPEDCDAKIRFTVEDFLSNVILAYREAKFVPVVDKDDPTKWDIRIDDFKLNEILDAAGQQEKARADRLTKREEKGNK